MVTLNVIFKNNSLINKKYCKNNFRKIYYVCEITTVYNQSRSMGQSSLVKSIKMKQKHDFEQNSLVKKQKTETNISLSDTNIDYTIEIINRIINEEFSIENLKTLTKVLKSKEISKFVKVFIKKYFNENCGKCEEEWMKLIYLMVFKGERVFSGNVGDLSGVSEWFRKEVLCVLYKLNDFGRRKLKLENEEFFLNFLKFYNSPCEDISTNVSVDENGLSDDVIKINNTLFLRNPVNTVNTNLVSKYKQTYTQSLSLPLQEISQSLYSSKQFIITGKGKSHLIHFLSHVTNTPLVIINYSPTIDFKSLLGVYSVTSTGGFKYSLGPLSLAVKNGYWLLVDNYDFRDRELIGFIESVICGKSLVVSGSNGVVSIADGFKVFFCCDEYKGASADKGIFKVIDVSIGDELVEMYFGESGVLSKWLRMVYLYLQKEFGVDLRFLVKLCDRLKGYTSVESTGNGSDDIDGVGLEFRKAVFVEVCDLVFCRRNIESSKIEKFADYIYVSDWKYFVHSHTLQLDLSPSMLTVGRSSLPINSSKKKNSSSSSSLNSYGMAFTQSTLKLIERLSICIKNKENVLLVGETGVGKTTSLQYISKILSKKLHVINLSQSIEFNDLVGSYKPINKSTIFTGLYNEFLDIFGQGFSMRKNESFFDGLRKSFGKWEKMCKLFLMGVEMGKKKFPQGEMFVKWCEFESKVNAQLKTINSNEFTFGFVEGVLTQAMRNGDWVLLDEINLAPAGVLDCLLGLEDLVLSDKGDVERVVVHEEFRLFGCMNPSTDVGKRELSEKLRSRFTEFYVCGPEEQINVEINISAVSEDGLKAFQDFEVDICCSEYKALLMIIEKYLKNVCSTKELEKLKVDIAKFYLFSCKLAKNHFLVSGSGTERPHFSLRTLTRALSYNFFEFKRRLYEGFYLCFCTCVSLEGRKLLSRILSSIFKVKDKDPNKLTLLYQESNATLFDFQIPCSNYNDSNVEYILTPTVLCQLKNLTRAVLSGLPILIQGPTSAGKTSMIEYLASLTKHRFVRINNHEHTDLQEYIGSYSFVSTAEGKGELKFQEGVLVQAMKNGWWIVLDELNLASSDVLEALNRLLDDNREIFIPETGEIVKPAPGFLLFATQNPAEYSGRKRLSRAFRNRFIELHFDSLPSGELVQILHKKSKIAESHARKLVNVYEELIKGRNVERIFMGKEGWITLRDLFRWAGRYGLEQEIGENGYMLLAERCRKKEDALFVKEVIEKYIKCHINSDALYNLEYPSFPGISWTKPMKRLFTLVRKCFEYGENALLVGETSCGKTTVLQCIAKYCNAQICILNCHQQSETSDILGSLRAPSFEWQDGPLVKYMKEGGVFVLDEISLAEDSVLERLNSVLEPGKMLVLAEKGSDVIEQIKACEKFMFGATMNPGGDFGKKELSPALRNRFTEIWIGSAWESRSDLEMIVEDRLSRHLKDFNDNPLVSKSIIDFAEWLLDVCEMEGLFGSTEEYRRKNTVVSLRDLLAWIEFFDCDLPLSLKFVDGAKMVFLDGLDMYVGEYMAKEVREKALVKLDELCFVLKSSDDSRALEINSEFFSIRSYKLKRGNQSTSNSDRFSFNAPTSLNNCVRVLRGLQLKSNKPILLEGAPGAGKTSLIKKMADLIGFKLVRINLSEQTDLMDLFGSEAPVESSDENNLFQWKDGPFLNAMKNGYWVLLDELNLASQSVLEGLNACLDHRASVYIPELDKTFPRHSNFRVFACQNPRGQGGGRKGLPVSFLNRFIRIYIDPLTSFDLKTICLDILEDSGIIGKDEIVDKLICLNERLLSEFGNEDFEFNLRDILRWIELYQQHGNFEHSGMVYLQRFSTQHERDLVGSWLNDLFGKWKRPNGFDNVFEVSSDFVSYRDSKLSRKSAAPLKILSDVHLESSKLEYIYSVMKCLDMSWMPIIYGAKGIGKSQIVRALAMLTGNNLVELNMNSFTETSDLLGGFEQVDYENEFIQLKEVIISYLQANIRTCIENEKPYRNMEVVLSQMSSVMNLQQIENFLTSISCDNETIFSQLSHVKSLLNSVNQSGCKFTWKDGLLIEAMKNGDWLLLKNANTCPPAVLDRLNSLLDSEKGTITVHEKGHTEDCIIKPHPNFRLIMTVANGEYNACKLSRAMRNRGIEIVITSDETDTLTTVPKIPLQTIQLDSELFYVNRLSDCCYKEFQTTNDQRIFQLNNLFYYIVFYRNTHIERKLKFLETLKIESRMFSENDLSSVKKVLYSSNSTVYKMILLNVYFFKAATMKLIENIPSTPKSSLNELQNAFMSKSLDFTVLEALFCSFENPSSISWLALSGLIYFYNSLTINNSYYEFLAPIIVKMFAVKASDNNVKQEQDLYHLLWNAYINEIEDPQLFRVHSLLNSIENMPRLQSNQDNKRRLVEAIVTLARLQATGFNENNEDIKNSLFEVLESITKKLLNLQEIKENTFDLKTKYHQLVTSKSWDLEEKVIMQKLDQNVGILDELLAQKFYSLISECGLNRPVKHLMPCLRLINSPSERILLESVGEFLRRNDIKKYSRTTNIDFVLSISETTILIQDYFEYLNILDKIRSEKLLVFESGDDRKCECLLNHLKGYFSDKFGFSVTSSKWVDFGFEIYEKLFCSANNQTFFIDPAYEMMVEYEVKNSCVFDVNQLQELYKKSIGGVFSESFDEDELLSYMGLSVEIDRLEKKIPNRMKSRNSYFSQFRQLLSLLGSVKQTVLNLRSNTSKSSSFYESTASTIDAVICRMESSFSRDYSDLINPIILVLSIIKFGMSMESTSISLEQRILETFKQQKLLLNRIPSQIEDNFSNLEEVFFVLESMKDKKSTNEALLKSVFNFLFNEAWNAVEAEEEERKSLNSSLYVYKDRDEEAAFEKENNDESIDDYDFWLKTFDRISNKKESKNFKEKVYDQFMHFYGQVPSTDKVAVVNYLRQISPPYYMDFYLQDFILSYFSSTCEEKVVQGNILLPGLFRDLYKCLSTFRSKVDGLLNDICAENSILIHIKQLIEKILSIRITSTNEHDMIDFTLNGCQILYEKSMDWNKYHQNNNELGFTQNLDELGGIVIKYRKKAAGLWKDLIFTNQLKRFGKQTTLEWIRKIYSCLCQAESTDTFGDVLNLINDWLVGSTIGDFGEKLQLIKGFSNKYSNFNILKRLVEYYNAVALPVVTSFIEKHSAIIEKEVDEYIALLNNWKLSTSLDFFAVLDTCKKSSRQLQKFKSRFKNEVLLFSLKTLLEENENSYLCKVKDQFEIVKFSRTSVSPTADDYKISIGKEKEDKMATKAADFVMEVVNELTEFEKLSDMHSSVLECLSDFKEKNKQVFSLGPDGVKKSNCAINQDIKLLEKGKKNMFVQLQKELKSLGLLTRNYKNQSEFDSILSILKNSTCDEDLAYMNLLNKFILARNIAMSFNPEAHRNQITKKEVQRLLLSVENLMGSMHGNQQNLKSVSSAKNDILEFLGFFNEKDDFVVTDEQALDLFAKVRTELLDCEFIDDALVPIGVPAYKGLTSADFKAQLNEANTVLSELKIPIFEDIEHPYLDWKSKSLSKLGEIRFDSAQFNGISENSVMSKLFTAILLNVQNIYKIFKSIEDPENLTQFKYQTIISNFIAILSNHSINTLIEEFCSEFKAGRLQNVDVNSAIGLLQFHLSILHAVESLVISSYQSCLQFASTLIDLTCLLVKHGFCLQLLPEEEQEDDENQEQGEALEGTGMDSGQGEQNVSDQIENEGQIEGLQDSDDINEDDLGDEDGIEMENDFEANSFEDFKNDAQDQDNDGDEEDERQEMDDKMDDLGDNADELDERMWNENDTDAEKKDENVRDNSVENEYKEGEVEAITGKDEAKDDKEPENPPEEQKQKDKPEAADKDDLEEDDLEEEEIDEGKKEGLEPRANENEEEKEDDNAELDLDGLNVDEEMEENINGETDEQENIDDKPADDSGIETDENIPENEDNEAEINEQQISEEISPENMEEQPQNDQDEPNVATVENEEEQESADVTTNGVPNGGHEEMDIDNDNKYENTEQQDSQANKTSDTINDDLDKEGSSVEMKRDSYLPPATSSLEEVLEYWKRNLNIMEANDESYENKNNEKDQENNDQNKQVQFVKEEQEHDDIVMADDLREEIEKEIKELDLKEEESKKQESEQDQMEEDLENQKDEKKDKKDLSQFSKSKTGKNKNDQKKDDEKELEKEQDELESSDSEMEIDEPSMNTKEHNQVVIRDQENIENGFTEIAEDEIYEIITQDYEAMTMEKARKIWQFSERRTSELANRLCEELRVILEPTKSSKLAGDFKTGKRLNMKKIVPFIASQYKKDKIWLRRVKPSIRQYQIMIAVDDSKSMAVSKCVSLAYQSLALVFKALTQLEVGEVSVVKFGEEVQTVHPFNQPLSSNSATEMISQFTFKQNKTRIPQLITKTLELLSLQQQNSTANLWQLCIIISDGLCEDHARIKRLLTEAKDKRIQIMFILLNHDNDELMTMKEVQFKPDGGVTTINYMDLFPFEYYLLMKSINNLPETLSQVIRQWFDNINRS